MYFEMEVGDYGTILIEVLPEEGLEEVWGETLKQRIDSTFDEVMDTIRILSGSFLDGINALDKSLLPQEVELEYGLAVEGEVGVVVARTASEAHFKVTLTWKLEDTETPN